MSWLLLGYFIAFFSSSLLCYSNFFYLACQVVPESPGDLEAEAGITETLKDWCALSSPVEFVIQNCGSSVHALRRYLPHGTPTDLYWQYLAWHEGRAEAGQPLKVFGPRSSGVEATEQSRPASWTTFWRVYTKWFEILRPRAKSDHGQCQTCFELQTDMYAKHFTPQQKLEKAHAWRVHLQHQYLDRQIYWSLRHAPKIKGSNILTIIIDSMDKKKTVWPKWAFDRPSKEIEKLGARPRVVITAALAHGYTKSWFFGSWWIEPWCRCLLRSPVPSCARDHPGPWSSALATTFGTAGGQHSVPGQEWTCWCFLCLHGSKAAISYSDLEFPHGWPHPWRCGPSVFPSGLSSDSKIPLWNGPRLEAIYGGSFGPFFLQG